jgi:cytosine/uracil/thiamine/allantoin permease
VELAAVDPIWMELYHYAWFIGFGVSFAVYGILMRRTATA